MKSLSPKITYYNHIALKFDNLSSAAAEVPVKFQSDWKSLNPKLMLRYFMKSCDKMSYCLVNKGPGSDSIAFSYHSNWIKWQFLIQNWYKNRIQSKLFQDQKNLPDHFKGAVKFGTFKFIDLKKKKNIKVAVFPCSLILCPQPCFCYLMRKFAFLWGKITIHKQQCTRMCRGVACKPGDRKV